MNRTLANGTRILLRPIGPLDKADLQRGMVALSPEARRHRFFSARDLLDPDTLIYLTEVDYRRHFAWVAVDIDRVDQPVVAVARYIASADEPGTAEIAFVVGDDYQRQGLATMLLELLSITARDNGIERFSARVLADNTDMRSILVKAGAKLTTDDAGVLATTMAVPAATGRFDRAEVLRIARAAARRRPRRSA